MESLIQQQLYAATEEPDLVRLPELHYLSIEGQSAPEDAVFVNAIQALYGVAAGFSPAAAAVPLEAYWWVKTGEMMQTPRHQWHWQVMLPAPDGLTREALHQWKSMTPQAPDVRWHTEPAGAFVQVLHQGSYEEEGPSIAKLMAYIAQNSLSLAGEHREIYLNDPGVTPEAELQTILRYRVK